MSWEQYANIIRGNRERAAQEMAEPPTECPLCGTVLQQRDGILNCPFGDYRITL